MSPSIRCALLALVVLLVPALARAELPTTEQKLDDKPWIRGVSEKEKQLAKDANREGTLLLNDAFFVDAAARYREALTHWDHPAIHFNLVLALLPLKQTLEIMDHLDAIERYGPRALDPVKLQQVRTYKERFGNEIADVNVSCDETGAVVKLDGKPLFTAPGRWTGRVLAGPHTVLASKAGFLTHESSQSMPPGKTAIKIKLTAIKDLTRYRPPFAEWPQWAALATGAAFASSGGYLHYKAYSGFKRFDSGIRDCGGCVPDPDLQSLLAGTRTQQRVAIAADLVGGALLGVGAVLLWFNRPQPYQITPEELEQPQRRAGILLIPSGAGLTVAGTF